MIRPRAVYSGVFLRAGAAPPPRSMTARSLPILMPRTGEQRYSCHGCAGCCRDFTVQLRPDDLARLEEQGWTQRLGHSPTVEFRGRVWLRQREDGSCIFLEPDGRCRIHAEFGLEAKPLACQLFPFVPMPGEGGVRIGLSYACPSMIRNRGAALSTHLNDLRRVVRGLPEIAQARGRLMLTDRLEATSREERDIIAAFERILARRDRPVEQRLDGAVWLADMLRQAKLDKVREERLSDLLDLLVDSFSEEIDASLPREPTARQMKVLRQVVFAHVEDVKIGEVRGRGLGLRAIKQYRAHRRFGRGRGEVPAFARDWPAGLRFEMAEGVGPARDEAEALAINELTLRYLHSRLADGRAWGSGYYAMPIITGLSALWVMWAATGWLARLHAGASRRVRVNMDDVEAALLRTDRASGRAPWLGSYGERLRLAWLAAGDGLRRLRHAMRLTDAAASPPGK